jgi:hypothetical protein
LEATRFVIIAMLTVLGEYAGIPAEKSISLLSLDKKCEEIVDQSFGSVDTLQLDASIAIMVAPPS